MDAREEVTLFRKKEEHADGRYAGVVELEVSGGGVAAAVQDEEEQAGEEPLPAVVGETLRSRRMR